MLPIPNSLGSKIVQFLGSILFGGVLATGLIGGAIMVGEFNSDGTASRTAKAPILVPFNARGTASGGNVKVNGGAKYYASCIPNPLTKLGTNYGSGTFVGALSLQMGPNPDSASYDVTFEKDCNSGTGGQLIANNVLLASGATLTLSGSRLPPAWDGLNFIKVATLSVNDSNTALRVRGFVMDTYGE